MEISDIVIISHPNFINHPTIEYIKKHSNKIHKLTIQIANENITYPALYMGSYINHIKCKIKNRYHYQKEIDVINNLVHIVGFIRNGYITIGYTITSICSDIQELYQCSSIGCRYITNNNETRTFNNDDVMISNFILSNIELLYGN